MQNGVVLLLFTFFFLISCDRSASVKRKPIAERREEEQRKKNHIQKGRYQCWRFDGGDSTAALPLYILSDEMYQLEDATGSYAFDQSANSISFLDGPLHQKWTGNYLPVYTDLDENAVPKEIIIEMKPSAANDSAKKGILRCKCSQFQY